MSLIKKNFWSRILGVILCGFSFSGCINLPKEAETYKIFYLKTLPFSEKEKNTLAPVEWQIVIEEPSYDGRLNTDKIVVQESSSQLSHVAGARWVDRLPNLIQQLLLNLFENSQKIQGVARPVEGIDADYILLVDVRDFELMIVKDKKEVKVRIFAKIMRLRDREIIGAQSFEKISIVSEDTFNDVIRAFLECSNSVGKDIVAWTLQVPQNTQE